MVKGLRKGLLRVLKGVPREVYRNVYQRMVEAEKEQHVSNVLNVTTEARGVMYKDAQDLFQKFMDASDEREESLREQLYAYLVDFKPDTLPHHDLRISVGTEGGTFLLRNTNFRTKTFPSAVDAQRAVYLNDLVERHFPGSTVRMKSAGEFAVADNFEGEHLTNAPLGIIKEYLEFSAKLSQILPNMPAKKERYAQKLLDENLPFLVDEFNIAADTVDALVSLVVSQYQEHARVPFWDRNPAFGNAKYRGDDIRSFDFTKADTLVIPLYELVQIVYSSPQDYVAELKEDARRLAADQFSCGAEDFNHFWSLGSLYYLTRQMRNERTQQNNTTSNYKNHLSHLLTEHFTIEAGNLLQRDLRRGER